MGDRSGRNRRCIGRAAYAVLSLAGRARGAAMRDRALLRDGDARARGDAARSHRDVRYRPPQHVLSRQPSGVRGRRDGGVQGPNDEPRSVPIYTIKSRPDVAAHLRRAGIEAGFDLALAQEFTVDHSVVVPLHFMTPTMRIPVIPIFVSGHIPPLPSAKRCYELGVTMKRAIESWPEPLRVVVIGSGSFSLEVFGPRIAPGKSDGVPDPDWAKRVCALARAGRDTDLADRSDARSDAARRQCRRRAAGLDRHAGRGRRAAAEIRHAADGAGARLCRLELELSQRCRSMP